MGRLLIRGGTVLSLGARTPNHAEADVLVEDGRIAEVGPGLRARDAEQVDATDAIVMPGFVDTHRHGWRSLLRNAGGSGPVDTAALAAHHRPDDVYAATLTGLLGAVATGTTTVVDWSDIQFDGTYTEAVVQAHVDAGLRTVLIPAPPPGTDAGDRHTDAVRKLAEAGPPGPTTTLAYGAPDLTTDDLDRDAPDWTKARALGVRIHTHATSRGAVSEAARRRLLGPDVTLVHCSGLDDADLDAIQTSGAAVSITPSTEMAGALGFPPLQRLIDRDIRPGLGVDDESLAPGDVFAQMRATQAVQHARYFDLKLAGKGGLPNLLTTRDVIRWATSEGARVAGLGSVTGSLEPGRHADIVVLRTDRPNIFPVNDPVGAVVWGMDSSNVDWVIVGGRPRVRAGAVDADLGRVRALAGEARDRVAAAAGLLAGSSREAGA